MRRVLPIFAIAWIAYFAVLHPRFMNWGATAAELNTSLPGDELMKESELRFTRAITIHAPASVVWQWIVQMGQDRGGFYSNTWLENLTGANIHNASVLHSEWQQRLVGDRVLLARRDLYGKLFAEGAQTPIVAVERNRWIAFIPTRFVLQPVGADSTRLLLRETVPSSRSARFINALIWDPMHFVMQQRMLRGIKERAEGSPLVRPGVIGAARIGWILCTLAVIVFFLSEHDRRFWILAPLLWGVPVLTLTGDWDAAIAAFLAIGITIGGALIFGPKWWPSYLVIATVVALILLLTPDPYSVFGLVLGMVALIGTSMSEPKFSPADLRKGLQLR